MSDEIIQHKPFLHKNSCWGCGPANSHGLRIESHWEKIPEKIQEKGQSGGEEAVCRWQGEAHHNAGRENVMNGGILAALIDCHAMCAAMDAMHARDMENGNPHAALFYLGTVALNVSFLAPTRIDLPVELRARITELTEKKAVVACSVYSDGKETVRAEVIGVRVPRD